MKLIVAMDPTGLIGDGSRIPWHYPEDFKYFRKKTLGGVLIMGRNTVLSLPKKLKGREVIGISNSDFDGMVEKADIFVKHPDIAHNIARGLNAIHRYNIWVAGGASIYKHYLENEEIEEAYITIVPPVDMNTVTNPIYFPKDKLDKDFVLAEENKQGELYYRCYVKVANYIGN